MARSSMPSSTKTSGSKVKEQSDSNISPKSHSSRSSSKINRGVACHQHKPRTSSDPKRKESAGIAEDKTKSSAVFKPREKKGSSASPKSQSSRSTKISRGPSLEQKIKSSSELSGRSSAGIPEERTKVPKRSVENPSEPAKKKAKNSASSIGSAARGRSDSRSVASARSRKKSTSLSRKRPSHDDQASGISSGERAASKSRRRKGSTATSGGILGAVSAGVQDFSFNF